MRRIWPFARLIWAGVAVLAAILVAAGVAAQTERRASNGNLVPTPDIESLDCPAIEETLGEIDLSGYRATAPVPEDHPDRAIYEYESALSQTNYENCILPDTVLQDAAPVFGSGFRTED